MLGKLNLIHHSHSGKLRPHEHTSYLPLAFLFSIVGLTLAVLSYQTYAASPGPEAGSIGITGTMPGPPPKVGATISTPSNGQHFTKTPVTIAGTCPKETIVQIYKNKIFAGSTPCDASGKYSIDIDLLFGKNVIYAQVYDVLNQAGPPSSSITIYYDFSLPQASPSSLLNFTDTQLLLSTDAAFRGSFPNQDLNVPVTVIGGTPPFAINVLWGDNANQVISRGDNTTFNANHAYKRPGTYKVTLQGSDKNNLVAFITVAAIINGKPEVLAAKASKAAVSKILLLWPVYAIAGAALISFWVGERREKKILTAAKTPEAPFGITSGINPAGAPIGQSTDAEPPKSTPK